MKSPDITIILNGIETVAQAFLKVNGREISKFWKNSSLQTLSKSAATTIEESLSSFLVSSEKLTSVQNLTTEIKERSMVVTESVKQYYQLMNEKNASGHQSQSDFNIEHSVLNSSPESSSSPDLKYGQIPNISTTVDSGSIKVIKNVYEKTPDNVSDTVVRNSSVSTHKTFDSPSDVHVKISPKKQPIHKIQKLSDRARERKVPASRFSRIWSYSGLGAGLALGAVAEGARSLLGIKPGTKETDAHSLLSANPFLSEANANRIVDTLCKVRGAALKLGQMLSIQDNSMINPQLAAVFERVRQSADFMPSWQMEKVLRSEFGDDWRDKFASFDTKPFAAASIGQVHCAKLHDGTEVAVKIQYPGVAQSIESDIKSLMSIINLGNILPKGLYVENAIVVAERELKKEVDYLHEAQSGKQFKKLLKDDPDFLVPEIYEQFSTKNILTTELVFGTAVDKLENADQSVRNKICEKLLELCLKEIFLFRFMQTDPNWSNFLYNFDTNQIVLLDFGACNEYTEKFVDTYMNIIKSSAEQDRGNVLKFSQELGFLTGYETGVMEEAHVDAVMILGEAFACRKPFNFRQQNMTNRIHDLVPIMLKHRLTAPPEETYSLHRKMSGIFLLCTKLGAVIDCSKLFNDVYDQYCSRK